MSVLLITVDSDDSVQNPKYEQFYQQIKQLQYSSSFSESLISNVRKTFFRRTRRRSHPQQCLVKHLLTYMLTLLFLTNHLHWSFLFLSISSIKFMSIYALNTTSDSQCLLVENSFIDRICSKTCRMNTNIFDKNVNTTYDIDWNSYYLPFCSNYSLKYSIDQTKYSNNDLTEQQCRNMLNELIHLDERARQASILFASYMQAIDSASNENRYSIINADCQQAYQTWACSIQIPYFHQNRLIPPCQTICDEVERVCPTFRPSDRQPLFAGQPLFYCSGGLLTNSDYGQRPYCFDTCHLHDHSVSSSSKTFVEDRKTTIECFDIEFLPLSTLIDSFSNQTINASLSSSALSFISSIFVNLLTMIFIYQLRTNIFNE